MVALYLISMGHSPKFTSFAETTHHTILDRSMDDLKFPNKLPRELWFEILLHLPPDEVSLMRQVCNAFTTILT